jgi:hypothetical protein
MITAGGILPDLIDQRLLKHLEIVSRHLRRVDRQGMAWNRGWKPTARDAGFPQPGGGLLCLSLVENPNLVPLSR